MTDSSRASVGNGAAEIRILDDDPQVLMYLARVVRSLGYTASEFKDPDAFLTSESTQSPDCLIVDWQLQGHDGLDIIARCQSQWPTTPAILVSGHVTVPVTVSAMRQGVVGVLQKPIRPDDLAREIASALEWSRKRSSDVQARAHACRLIQNLTELETTILKLIVDGTPNKNIATQTNLAIRTVEKYRRIVFDKLEVDSAAEAARIWVLANLDQKS
jgi:FixJ family two-component response regulator